MILRAIEVESFRCFDRPVRLEGFAPGLNVLFGPNGAGKSTLLRALRHALVDSYSLSGAQVKQAMTPWGRALSPRIRVVFEHGGSEWRIEKRFLTGASSLLECAENGVFRPVADGREADQRVRDMLAAEAAAKGMAGETHLGLLQVLWTPQGPPLLSPWNPNVRATLQEAFGAALSSPAADALVDLVDQRFQFYYTPTGKVGKNSPITPLQNDFNQLSADAEQLRAAWQSASIKREELAKLADRLSAAESRAAELEPLLASRAQAASAEKDARLALDPLERQLADTRARHQQAAQLPAAEARLEAAAESLRAARADQQRIDDLDAHLGLLRKNGEDAREWPDLLRLRELSAARNARRAELEALRAPSPQALQQINAARQSLHIKEAELRAASLRVTVEAEVPLDLESPAGPTHAAPGAPLVLTGPQSVTVRIPGVAIFTAESANAQAGMLAREVEALRTRLETLLQGETAEALEGRAAKAATLREALGLIDAEIAPLEARGAALTALAARRPDWESAPPDLEAIRAEWRQLREEQDRLKAASRLSAAINEEATARAALTNLERTLTDLDARLARYPAVESLDERHRQAVTAGEQAAAALSAVEAALRRLGDPVSLDAELQSLRAQIQRDRESRARLEGELKSFESQNLYSRLADAEARLTDTTGKLARERRRAEAIQLLKTTLAQAIRDQTAALPGRIADAATANWRRVAGPGAPAIRIGDGWTPDGLHVPGAAAALDELSGGEAEQVAFATRLALASQLAQTARQLAVFDDAFLATDPVRAERILTLLAEAAENLQIVLLTCHPARYENLPAARFFDLEKLKQ